MTGHVYRNDDFPGFTIQYKPESFIPKNQSWLFMHDDYDGAEDSKDDRYGRGQSAFDCWEQIKELEQAQ